MIQREDYIEKLKNHKDNELIKVVTGVRRCGKSTLLKQYQDYLIDNGVNESNIIYINLELMEYDYIKNYETLYETIKERIKNSDKYYIFIDEIQNVENWQKAINSLNIDSNVDIYLTGSNSHLFSGELATMLSGRYVEIKMLPFSFKEYKKTQHHKSDEEMFKEYLKYGSLPLISQLNENDEIKREYLENLYNTIVVRDIISKSNINNVELIKNLLVYIISNTGSLISAKKISDYLKHDYKKNINPTTISNYLELLEKAYIIYRVPRYNIKGKKLLKNLSKYYVIDNGIRNMLLGYQDTDEGHILETIVYFELLRRGYKVYVGKCYDKEIDFIAIKPDEIIYYQVTKSLSDEKVKKRELDSLKKIPDNYEKIILTMDDTYITDNEGIKYKNIIDFLNE